MDLDPAEVGYFISQVGLAAASFGVSSADVQTVGGALMAYFDYACLPPMAITDGPQLQSICINPKCPKAANAQCNLYPYGGFGTPPEGSYSCMA